MGKRFGIQPANDESLALAAAVVREGGLVVIPTDTVYGVACDPANPDALARLFAAKRRPAEKSVQVLLSRLDELAAFGLALPAPLDVLAQRFCPGGFSPICVASAECPFATVRKPAGAGARTQGFRTQGIRIPDSPVALAVLQACGPLACSSANLSGRTAPQTAREAFDQLEENVALYLDGGPTPGATASTVVETDAAAPGGFRVIREGVVPRQALLAALQL